MNALVLLALTTLAASEPSSTSDDAAPPCSAGNILLAPKVGFFKSTTPLSGDVYMAAEVGYLTPLLKRRLAVVFEVGYQRPSTSGTLTDPQLGGFGTKPDGGYTLASRQVSFLLSAVFRFDRALASLTPYVGAGAGLYLHRITVDAFGATSSQSDSGPGLQALAGLEFPLGPGGAFFEAHYHFAPVTRFITTGDVNMGGFLVGSLGYRLRL